MAANLKGKVDQLVSDLTSQTQTLDDLNGLFRSLMTSARERMLDTAMEVHLGRKTLPPLLPPILTPPLSKTGVTGTRKRPSAANAVNLPSIPRATASALLSPSSSPNTNAASPAATRRSWPWTPRA